MIVNLKPESLSLYLLCAGEELDMNAKGEEVRNNKKIKHAPNHIIKGEFSTTEEKCLEKHEA